MRRPKLNENSTDTEATSDQLYMESMESQLKKSENYTYREKKNYTRYKQQQKCPQKITVERNTQRERKKSIGSQESLTCTFPEGEYVCARLLVFTRSLIYEENHPEARRNQSEIE